MNRDFDGADVGRLLFCAAVLGLACPASSPAQPPGGTAAPQELPGSIEPSILVPPVRTGPPALTRPIERPQQYDPQVTADKQRLPYRMESLRLAIEDLIETFGQRYPRGAEFLGEWDVLAAAIARDEADVEKRFAALRRRAMLANPLIDADQLLVLRRKKGQLGLPTNHQCNAMLNQQGYENQLAIYSLGRPGLAWSIS